MIVAGIGCRRGALAPDVEAAIQAALATAGIAANSLGAIATSLAKQDEAAITATAAKLGIDFVVVPEGALRAAGTRAVTRSARVVALAGVPSVAEAAALAAAGPASRLIVPRQIVGAATCALAQSEAAP